MPTPVSEEAMTSTPTPAAPADTAIEARSEVAPTIGRSETGEARSPVSRQSTADWSDSRTVPDRAAKAEAAGAEAAGAEEAKVEVAEADVDGGPSIPVIDNLLNRSTVAELEEIIEDSRDDLRQWKRELRHARREERRRHRYERRFGPE